MIYYNCFSQNIHPCVYQFFIIIVLYIFFKKLDATILSKARRLGLSHKSLGLQSFSTRGVCFIAKELIKIYSSSASSSNERYNSMMSIIKPFCEEASVIFDEAIVQYSKQLCFMLCYIKFQMRSWVDGNASCIALPETS